MDRKIETSDIYELKTRIEAGETIASIAREYKCATASIYRAFAREGIKLRSMARWDFDNIRNEAETMPPREAVEFLLNVIEMCVPESNSSDLRKWYDMGFTKTQGKILAILEQKSGEIVSYDTLCYRCGIASERSLHVLICQIRKKNLQTTIKTVHSTGYVMEESK